MGTGLHQVASFKKGGDVFCGVCSLSPSLTQRVHTCAHVFVCGCTCVCVGCPNLPPYGLFYQVTQRTALLGDRDARRSLIHLHICSEDRDGREGKGGGSFEMDKMQIGVKLVCRALFLFSEKELST